MQHESSSLSLDQQEEWAEEGCFVFQLVANQINAAYGVRCTPDVSDESRTGMVFNDGDLVSVDRIQPSIVPGSTNGPFLRLSDQQGWLFQRKHGLTTAKRLPVESGLWAFYVDNYPFGIAPRCHPIDSSKFKVAEVDDLKPLQKIYCDRMVVHPTTGVCWYRVQGTAWWVFDRRKGKDPNEDDHYMLLDETQVKTGLFAYIALRPLGIRGSPRVDAESNKGRSVREGDIVVASAVRQSPFRAGNGPFLYLSDGSGWLFENKWNEQMMKEIAIESGRWMFRVQNGPAGLCARRHPLDDCEMAEEENNYKLEPAYGPDSLVDCDCKIASPTGVNFYRIAGTQGWIFDRREGIPVLELVSSGPPQATSFVSQSSTDKGGWSTDFVRGIAATVPGTLEILLNETSRVISFRTVDGVRVNVYYSTRTVGTAMDHPGQGKTQLFRRDCSVEELIEILRNPRVHTGKGYKRKHPCLESKPPAIVHTTEGSGILIDVEEEIRNDLLDNDKEMKSLQEKRLQLLKSIKVYDDARRKYATARHALVTSRQEELDSIRRAREDELKKQMLLEQLKQLRERTCAACGKEFGSANARDQHCFAAHGHVCQCCGNTFQSFRSLDQHRNALNHHW